VTATASPTRLVGGDLARIEGTAKVTGEARYAGEVPFDDLIHGAVVTSTVARGRIVAIDVDSARAVPGVLDVLTHENAERLGEHEDGNLHVLQSDRVHYRGEVVALVLAASSEVAREVAHSLSVVYDEEPHDVVFSADHPQLYVPDHVNPSFPSESSKGDLEGGLARSTYRVDVTYSTPSEHNNPMEPHATTARWADGRLTVHDSTQGASGVKDTLAILFGLEAEAVRVLSPHVGGGFGSKGTPRPNVVLAAMATRALDRPVRVVLTRQQQFSLVGYRTPTVQRLRLGCDADGRLLALEHTAFSQTSTVLEFTEQTAVTSRSMYAAEALRTSHQVVALDVPTPRWMRAPGEAPGAFGLESAMDELAEAAGMDPVDLRIVNDSDVEPAEGTPFSSRHLVECLREGAARFGWHDRDPRPGTRRDGRWLLGTGVASSLYPARSAPSSAAARYDGDGRFTVQVTAADIGTGARTVLHQVAADELGTDLEHVTVEIADSDFGSAMIAGGSMGTASWSWAVVKACRELLAGPDRDRPGHVVRVHTGDDIKAQKELARYAFGAQFAEVAADISTGEVRVRRLLGVFAAGRIVNSRTARSQFLGGMTMGLSMALHEEAVMDPAFGDYVNHDLAGYHVATNADVPEIEVSWLDEQDDELGPVGAKGIGEIGIVGTAAAIANATWHATGVRQRDLPIRPDRVLAG
jgi:xanthine dehydrogenase YagR molybdenum-binding subunit